MGCTNSKTKESAPTTGPTSTAAKQSAPVTSKPPQASTTSATQAKPAAATNPAASASTTSIPAASTATPASTTANSAAPTTQTTQDTKAIAKEAPVTKDTPAQAPSTTASAIKPTPAAVPAAVAVPSVVSEPQVGPISDPAPVQGVSKTAGLTAAPAETAPTANLPTPLSRGAQLAQQAELEQQTKAAQPDASTGQPAVSNQSRAGLSRGAQLALQAEQQLESENTTYGADQQSGAQVSIIVYSTYGHILELARAEKRGVESVPGVSAKIYQVPETLSPQILQKMHSPPKPWDNIPTADASSLPQADGFLLGTPTRFGNISGQFKQFWDSTGSLWQRGVLHGKPFGMFVSTATQGGGQEETFRSAMSNFVHHGMIFVPLGNTFGPELFNVENLHGGGAWGAGTFAGATGARQPSQLELQIAEHQGKSFAYIVKKMKLSGRAKDIP